MNCLMSNSASPILSSKLNVSLSYTFCSYNKRWTLSQRIQPAAACNIVKCT
jgi:hypothetical protein